MEEALRLLEYAGKARYRSGGKGTVQWTIAGMTTPHNTTLTLTRPDDWHLHVRDGEPLHTVVPAHRRPVGRAIIMPNLRPPVTTAAAGAGLQGAHPGRRARRRGV